MEQEMSEAAAEAKLPSDALCSCNVVHEDKVRAALGAAPSPDALESLAELFKVFSDLTRIRILTALSESELCVCDLQAVLGASQSAISHQLAILRAARLVRTRRDGKTIYYALADSHVRAILLVGLDHVGEKME
jgi:ArsR family transcriptional regulator, lead/cadmium/zinc/bismuth-responsive transcriptional repressor